jgi:cytochrome c556
LLAVVVSTLGCQTSSNKSEQARVQDTSAAPQAPVELAALMGDLQRYAHKMALSAHAQNRTATLFYLHETRAITTEIKEKVPTYEGYSIATLMDQIFVPRVDSLDAAMDRENWDEIATRIDEVVRACNTCHSASAHGFVRITEGVDKNPYNQSFELQE